MRCSVCGAESGKYPLCRDCNIKKEKGEIIKCKLCNKWHYADAPCQSNSSDSNNDYLYDAKKTLISKSEQGFYQAIVSSIPDGYHVFPQVNLAAFIIRTDGARFQNELYRNVDFLLTDSEYRPKIVIEINDQSHLTSDRKERDAKVQSICEEAGIPILKLWTSYGINSEYIQKRINELLNGTQIVRVHHFAQTPTQQTVNKQQPQTVNKKKGCYVATCVYGSYDCPQVWTLRRYRDDTLAASWYGRAFIRLYYAISPALVRWFGKTEGFKKMWRGPLDRIVKRLNGGGVEDTPYRDRSW